MTTDIWLPRILAISQVVLLACCAALIALGHDSTITNLFAAGAGSLIGSSVISAAHKNLTNKGKDTPT
jgi:hypothetical protein